MLVLVLVLVFVLVLALALELACCRRGCVRLIDDGLLLVITFTYCVHPIFAGGGGVALLSTN